MKAKTKQSQVNNFNLYMLMVSTKLKGFKLSIKPRNSITRNSITFCNLALIEKELHLESRNGAMSVASSYQCTFFITKERESQRPGTYIAHVLQKLTVFSTIKKLIQDSFNEPISQCFVT